MVDSAEDRDVGDSQGDEEEGMTGVEEDEVISDVKEDEIMPGAEEDETSDKARQRCGCKGVPSALLERISRKNSKVEMKGNAECLETLSIMMIVGLKCTGVAGMIIEQFAVQVTVQSPLFR